MQCNIKTKSTTWGDTTANNTDTHWYPKPYKGSAEKSMEAFCAVVLMVTEMYHAGIYVISILLTDDNSSIHSNTCHSFQVVMTVKRWTNKAEHWPKRKGGKYIANRGKLPIQVCAIDKFLADPSYYGKSFDWALYKLEGKCGRELKFTAVNCKRLKQNFNFW